VPREILPGDPPRELEGVPPKVIGNTLLAEIPDVASVFLYASSVNLCELVVTPGSVTAEKVRIVT
jgi:hypothetical protein